VVSSAFAALAVHGHSNDSKCYGPHWTSSSLSSPLTLLYELALSARRHLRFHENGKQNFPLNRESAFFVSTQYLLPLASLGEIEQQDLLDHIHFRNGNT